jgi:hypothetical protein
MADYFETIEYANQYDGRIEARAPVPLKDLPGVIRLASVNIRVCDDGSLAIDIRINKVKEAAEKAEIVGRDAELERVILRRLNVQSKAKKTVPGSKKERGATETARAKDSTGRIQIGDRLYIRVLNTLVGNPINGGYRVEPSGKVPLGPSYGRVQVNGLTPEEAEVKIRDHLAAMLRDPQVSLTWYDPVVHGTRQAPGNASTRPQGRN